MQYVQLSSKLHAHPTIRGLRPRSVCAWLFSILWLSRNGRVDTFPRKIAKEFGATPKDVETLIAKELWVDEGDNIYVPQWHQWYGPRTAMQLWKFGPLETARPKIPDAVRCAVYDRDGHACLHCGTDENLSLDHIHPYSLGGPDTLENLQTLCRRCNSRKGARV